MWNALLFLALLLAPLATVSANQLASFSVHLLSAADLGVLSDPS